MFLTKLIEVASIKDYEKCQKRHFFLFKDKYNRLIEGKIGCFTSTDDYGYLLLQASNLLKISIPENIQIVGFDGGKER